MEKTAKIGKNGHENLQLKNGGKMDKQRNLVR